MEDRDVPSHPSRQTPLDQPIPYKRHTVPKELTKVSIPSVDEFRLSHILSNVLKDESEQVAQSLLHVVANYQQDLRKEVKHKISTEQKIQYKNISIAKLTYNLHKTIEHKNKKLLKLYLTKGNDTEEEGTLADVSNNNTLDKEVSETLNYAFKVSGKVRNLSQRLLEIDKRLNQQKSLKVKQYPKLVSLLDILSLDQTTMHSLPSSSSDLIHCHSTFDDNFDKESNKEMEPTATEILNETEQDSLVLNSNVDYLIVTSENDVQNVDQEVIGSGRDDVHGMLVEVGTKKPTDYTEIGSNDERASILDIKDTEEFNEEDSMDQQKFEVFMSESIQKYRELQEDKYNDSDLFESYGLPPSSKKDQNESTPLGTNNSKFTTNNPLNLLYSNLILGSLMALPSTEESATSLIFLPSMSVKLAATVKQSLRNSHFKKLRINGNPITSATFQNMKDKPKCACDEHKGISNESDSPIKINNMPDLEHLDICSEIEDEELTYSSSALNSDENESDLLLGSSDDDSDDNIESNAISDEGALSRVTNEYYISLQRKLKRKRRTPKQFIPELAKDRDESPTPKHKPSHRTLKPKRSILKSTPHGGPKRLAFSEVESRECPPTEEADVIEHTQPINTKDNIINVPHQLNYSVSPVMVLGTILTSPESDTIGQEEMTKENRCEATKAQTISNLRVLLEQDAH